MMGRLRMRRRGYSGRAGVGAGRAAASVGWRSHISDVDASCRRPRDTGDGELQAR